MIGVNNCQQFLVIDSESENGAVLFVIVTPVMLDEDLYQKYNR